MEDWKKKAKKEYLRGGTSYRKLAEKYGVSRNQIEQIAKREGWVALKRQIADKTAAKTVEILSDQQANRAARIQTIADRLLDKLEKAVDELNLQLVKNTEKEKIIEYDHMSRPDKVTREVVHESEMLTEVTTMIDRKGLREITAALKDVRDIQMIRSEADVREQEARIANLERQAQNADAGNEPIQVILSSDLEEYAQ